jgi:MoaA/NifB/PqqE/SkfB family radical SAM enzyme
MDAPAPFDPRGPLHAPPFRLDEGGAVAVCIDTERARWLGVSRGGARVLARVRDAGGIRAAEFAEDNGAAEKGFLRFLDDAARRGFLANSPFPRVVARNRRERLAPRRLHEFWVVTNDHCNLRCRHCYTIEKVKQGFEGLAADVLEPILSDARELGTEVFYFTGGEPTLRPDFLRLARFVLERAKLVLFTNGHFLDRELVAALAPHRDRLVVQVSIDGHDEATSRKVRGKGSFDRALAGVATALEGGLRVGVSSTPNGVNHEGVAELTERLAALAAGDRGVDYHHLILLLDRGGARDHEDVRTLTCDHAEQVVERSAEAIRAARSALSRTKMKLTNEKIFDALATNGPAKDYCGAGYTILGVAADGKLLPCAACMDDERFFLGDLVEGGGYRRGRLAELWLESAAVERIRRFSLAPEDSAPVTDLRYFHGGGCWKNMDEPGAPFPTAHPFAEFYERQMLKAIRRAAAARGTADGDEPRVVSFQHAARIACSGERKTDALPVPGDPGAPPLDQGHCICFA